MKTCSKCKEQKSYSDFNKNAKYKDGHADACRSCYQKYQKEWYELNKTKRRQQLASYDKKRIDNNRHLLVNYLKSHPCVDCQQTDIRLLDFDHQGDKRMNVSKMLKHSWGQIELEIAKCDVRCVVCHRLKTAKDYAWWPEKFA